MSDHSRLFIGGGWREPATAAAIEIFSPSTGERIGRVPEANAQDAATAVAAARRALDQGAWANAAPAERARYLRAAAGWLESREQPLLRLLADEAGIPVGTNAGVRNAVERCLYYADLAEGFAFEEIRIGKSGEVLVRHEPAGVLAAIVPWNAPLGLAFMKLAPALAAGCATVLKPSPETPLSAYLLAEMAEAIGLPAGVLNILPAGSEGSAALVADPGVDIVSFTGSTRVGAIVGEVCGGLIRRCVLELGGKSAAILLDDVDLAAAMPGLIRCAMTNNGQACILQSRILVPRHREEEIVAALVDAVRALPVGDPHDPATRVGPLINAAQLERVRGYVATGMAEGARLVYGGVAPANLSGGHYITPAIFADVDNRMHIAREEIFGPVLSVISYDGDPVEVANDSPFGLSGTVWTTDPARGLDVARRTRTGNFGLNRFGMDVVAPFGGYKQSGLGRENGKEGLIELLETKSIHLPAGLTVTTEGIGQ